VTAATLPEAKRQGAVLAWGNFIKIVLNFLIVAWVMFWVARLMNRLKRLEASQPAAVPPALVKRGC
jgi:large conductance mechanosensitive channel